MSHADDLERRRLTIRAARSDLHWMLTSSRSPRPCLKSDKRRRAGVLVATLTDHESSLRSSCVI